LGAKAAAAEAVIGKISAAHASTSHPAPAAASIVAAKMPSFAMQAPCLAMGELWLGNDASTSWCRPHCGHGMEIPIYVAVAPHDFPGSGASDCSM
jgi:hypothetical protein